MNTSVRHLVFAAVIFAASAAVAAPAVTSITPNSGPLAGGSVVTIRGSGFVAATTTVTFGGVAGTVNTGASSTIKLIVTTPARATPGAVNVDVTEAGTTTVTNGFRYVNDTLIVTAKARVASIVDIAWNGDGGAVTANDTASDSAGNSHNSGTDTSAFVWTVGASGTDAGTASGDPNPTTVAVSLGSQYDLQDEYPVYVRNLGTGTGTTIRLLARTSATTTPVGLATTGWTLDTTLPTALNEYAIQANAGAGAATQLSSTDQQITAAGGIAPNAFQQLLLSYYTPATVTQATADGNQNATITLTAQRN